MSRRWLSRKNLYSQKKFQFNWDHWLADNKVHETLSTQNVCGVCVFVMCLVFVCVCVYSFMFVFLYVVFKCVRACSCLCSCMLYSSTCVCGVSSNPWNYSLQFILYCICESIVFFSRVQEIMGDDQKEAGRIPRTIECELTNDLGETFPCWKFKYFVLFQTEFCWIPVSWQDFSKSLSDLVQIRVSQILDGWFVD